MGYRSEVILAVGPEVMPQFMVTMAKSPEARALCFAEATRHENYEEKGNMLFAWDGIKWYDSFECVSALNDFMDWCDGEDIPTGEKNAEGKEIVKHGEECFKFIRIGEEMEDVETRGDAMWGEICVNRSIEF